MGQNTLEDKNRKIQSGGDSVPLVLTNISLQPGTIMHKQLPFAQIGVAAIPLLVSFPIALWGETEPITLAMLIAIMFLCSVCLLILTMKEGLKVYCIARPILVGGFVFWYSYPGFIEVILGKPWNDGLPIAVSPQVVAWTVVYLSIFLFTSMLTATLFFSPRLTNKGNVSVWRINDGSVVALAVIAVLVGFIPYFLGGNGLDNLLVSITSARGIVKP